MKHDKSGLFQTLDSDLYWAYCGPTALSAVTGADIADINELVAELRIENGNPHGKSIDPTRIASTRIDELEIVLGWLGWKVDNKEILHEDRHGLMTTRNGSHVPMRVNVNPTLSRFEKEIMEPDITYLVVVKGHIVAVRNGHIADTVHRVPRPIRGSRWVRHRVDHYFEVSPIG